MRMLDPDERRGLRRLQLYLSVNEAETLVRELQQLLSDPESRDHCHVFDADDASRELSASLVTESKLDSGRYTELERRELAAE